MLDLNTTIIRNARAAGREHAHAVNDGAAYNPNTHGDRDTVGVTHPDCPVCFAYLTGYQQGRSEG